jgi:ribonuclease P/MRP protein subunit POP1
MKRTSETSLNNKQRKKAKQQQRLELPRSLTVTDEVGARKQEIQVFQEAIKNASEFTGNVRVFQTVNRYQRRRAASLNPKRLPKLVQPRAIAQMAKDPQKNKKPVRKMIRKKFTKRSHPQWLETHCWHAKRMVMVELGYTKVALKPNQKSQKSTYRALRDESFFRDVSYHQVLYVHGDVKVMDALFQSVCDPTSPKVMADRYRNKYGSGWIHEWNEYPKQSICKVGYLRHPNGQGVWLWIPSYAYSQVFKNLYLGLCRSVQGQNVGNDVEVKVEDVTVGPVSLQVLKDDYVRFEMRGPRSHSVLQHVLIPEKTLGYEQWQKMKGLSDAKQVAPGTVISLEIQDPRIKYLHVDVGFPY